jgi:S-adenosylmethionine:tRNA ribosyltransferase-isomerase
MFISDFEFQLPPDLIAQEPLLNRDGSRMLVVDKGTSAIEDKQFAELPSYLRDSDVLVLNNTKVFPARLLGRSETGAAIELFLVEEVESGIWSTLARPAKRLSVGKKIQFGDLLEAEVLEKTEAGRVIVKCMPNGNFDDIVQKIGQTPLPPYIKREGSNIDSDRERYQTVYASRRGAIAAPTAGLHFTPQIFSEIKKTGAAVAELTLHIGYGTFEPVRVTDLSEHSVASERYEISEVTAKLLNDAKREKRRIIAVGTTTTRALESSVRNNGEFIPGQQTADLTITPGYEFKAVDALLTNFHLPQSSLLVLVAAFAGYELTMRAYEHAVRSRYRFYSYGDCMFIT